MHKKQHEKGWELVREFWKVAEQREQKLIASLHSSSNLLTDIMEEWFLDTLKADWQDLP